MIDFKDILGAHTAEFGQEDSPTHKDVWETQGRWSFKFVIVTQERRYHLHSASEDERKLWMLDFELILKESKKETKSRFDDAKDLYNMLPEENQKEIEDRMKIAKQLKSMSNSPERSKTKMVSEEKLQIFRTMDIDDYFCKEVEKVANSIGIKSIAAQSRKPRTLF